MELVLERKFKKANYTIGNLFLRPSNTAKQARAPFWGLGGLERGEGLSFICNTLEPPVGTLEEMRTAGSKKAIPPGTYSIHMVWSPRFQERLPVIEDISTPLPRAGKGKSLQGEGKGVLGSRGHILIHAGNTVHDTAGCILVGKNTQVGRVLESRKTLTALLSRIRAALSAGEDVELEIQ